MKRHRADYRDEIEHAEVAVKEVFRFRVEYEPYKSYKEYKPHKSYREYAPYQPYLSRDWSQMPLLFLIQGGN